MKFLLNALSLLVVVLLLSASCVCPVVADGVVSSPLNNSSSPSFFLDDSDVYYLFTTFDDKQGFIHERDSRIVEMMVDNQWAGITSVDAASVHVTTSGGYHITYHPSSESFLVSLDNTAALPASDLALPASSLSLSGDDDGDLLCSVESSLRSMVSPEYLSIVSLGVLIAGGYVSAVPLTAVWLYSHLMGVSASESAVEYVLYHSSRLTASSSIASLTSFVSKFVKLSVVAALVGFAIEVLTRHYDRSSYHHFIIEKDGKFYKYDVHFDEETAKYLGEVPVRDGKLWMSSKEVLVVDGRVYKVGDTCSSCTDKEILTIAENLPLKDGKYYDKTGDGTTLARGIEINYNRAKEVMKDCKKTNTPHGIFAAKDTCLELCRDVTRDLGGIVSDVESDAKHKNSDGYYQHCHPQKKDGGHCFSHCWWY